MSNKDGCDESKSRMQLQCDGDGFLIWLTRQRNGLTQKILYLLARRPMRIVSTQHVKEERCDSGR